MIRNFSDHAANERTFLAWIRTAIAVMAFGFLVAKFELFLKIAALSLGMHRATAALNGNGLGGAAGIILIVAGMLIVVLATVRFIRTESAIESAGARSGGSGIDLALATLLVALGIALVFYLAETLASGL